MSRENALGGTVVALPRRGLAGGAGGTALEALTLAGLAPGPAATLPSRLRARATARA